MANLSRSCCISPCIYIQTLWLEWPSHQHIHMSSTYYTFRVFTAHVLQRNWKDIALWAKQQDLIQSTAYLKKSSFIKPLLHRHHFIICILPLICHNRCYSVSRYFRSCKLTLKCFLSFLCMGFSIRWAWCNFFELGTWSVKTAIEKQLQAMYTTYRLTSDGFTNNKPSAILVVSIAVPKCLPATLPLAVDNPLQHSQQPLQPELLLPIQPLWYSISQLQQLFDGAFCPGSCSLPATTNIWSNSHFWLGCNN